MSRSSRLRVALVCMAAALLSTNSADAQIGGLIKRKAADAIKGTENTVEKPAEKSGALPGGVVEITSPVFEGIVNGLKVEVALRREFKAELAKLPTRDQYNQCLTKLVASPEYQKIQLNLGSLPENATAAQTTAAMQKMHDDTQALTKKMCPVNPDDWSDYKKQQRLTEFRKKAVEASGHTDGVFNVHLERLDKLCGLRADNALPKSGGFQTPGTGNKVFWIFTPGELTVMDDSTCTRFKDLYAEVR